MKRIFITFLVLSLTFILTGCFKKTTTVENVDIKPKAETTTVDKTHSWTGTLKPVSNTRIADGTHVLLTDQNEFVAELYSKTVDLTAYEGQDVNLTGIPVEKNGHTLIEVTKVISESDDPVSDLLDVILPLTVAYDTEVEWTSATFTLIDSSENAGTAAVVAEVDPEFYTIKFVRKDDPLTGTWSISTIYESTSSELEKLDEINNEDTDKNIENDEDEDSDEDMNSDDEEDTDEDIEDEDMNSDEEDIDEDTTDTDIDITIDSPTTIDPQISESSISESTLQGIVAALPSHLTSEYELGGNAVLSKLEFSSPNFVYVTYNSNSGNGMVLLTYTQTDNGISFSEKAVFTPGESSDWSIDSGVNSAKNLAKDVFVNDGSTWDFEGNVSEGYDLFNWSTGVTFEVPYSWYYWQRGNSVAFSSQPVEEDNIATEIYYSDSDIATALATFEGAVTSEGDITLGEHSGKKQILEDGTIRYAVDYGDYSLIIEALPENKSQAEHILSSISAE